MLQNLKKSWVGRPFKNGFESFGANSNFKQYFSILTF